MAKASVANKKELLKYDELVEKSDEPECAVYGILCYAEQYEKIVKAEPIMTIEDFEKARSEYNDRPAKLVGGDV